MFNIFMRHQPAQGDQPVGMTFFNPLRRGRDRIDTVADNRDTRNTELREFVGAGLRDGDGRRAAMHPRRHNGFQPPADTRQYGARDWPLFTVTMVGEQDDRLCCEQSGEEGDTVLGINNDVDVAVALQHNR